MAAAGAWALAFASTLYLGLSGGGYDELVWGQVGLALWWLVLLGAAVGVLPVLGLGRSGWLALGALGALVVWTALGIGWGESAERGALELARLATYLGAFVAALAAARAGHGRALVGGLTVGLTAVGSVALLSHLHPSWFPADEAAPFLSESNRLAYPLGYFNALAALLALGIALLLGSAAGARSLAGRALAAAGVPALALALYFTLSRGGTLATGVAVLVLLALSPSRVLLLGAIASAGAGSGLLIAVAEGGGEGDGLILLTVAVGAAVGLLQIPLATAAGRWKPPARPRVPTRRLVAAACVPVLLAVVAFLAAGGASRASDKWREFQEPDIPAQSAATTGKFASVSARGRYQFWSSALDAARSEPLVGIGPGSFEFWWARNGNLPIFVRHPHSLYLETFAELGAVGLLLIVLFVGVALVSGVRRALDGEEDRALMAAATAACAAFALSAALEWVWDVAVVALAFLMLAAVAVCRPGSGGYHPPGRGARALLAVAALAALAAIVPPLTATSAIRSSEDRVAEGRYGPALDKARTAERAQPYAATPELQQALIEERLGRLRAAAAAAARATEDESTNWRPWAVLFRLEARRGRAAAARRAYLKARSLNPRSRLFPG